MGMGIEIFERKIVAIGYRTAPILSSSDIENRINVHIVACLITVQQPRLPCHICLAPHRLQLWFKSSCQLRRLLHSLLPYPHMKSRIPR
jgi:hypothetical protein